MDKYRNPTIEVNTIVYQTNCKEDSNGNSILLIKRGKGDKLSFPFAVLKYNVDPLEESFRLASEFLSDLEPQTAFFTVRGDPKRDSSAHIVAFVYTIKASSSSIIKDQAKNKTAQLYSFESIAKMTKEQFYSDHLDILNQFIHSNRK